VLASVFGADKAVLIDTATDRVTGEIAVPQPHNAAISPDGRTAYVGSQQKGSTALVLVDLGARTVLDHVSLDNAPRALNFSPDGSRLWFTLAGVDAVQALDPAAKKVVGQIPVGASPHHPLFTPDGRLGLTVSQGPGELEVLDPLGRAPGQVVKVGTMPHWIALSADGRTAYVTNEGSGDVSVVDLATRAVTATIPVGAAPRKIAIQPGAVAASDAAAGAAPTPAASAATTQASADARGQSELAVRLDDYTFSPAVVRGEPGQRLTLVLTNAAHDLHNFSIPGQGIDQDVAPGGTVRVSVTLPQSGTVAFSCKLHASLGMQGTLAAGDSAPPAQPTKGA
jgi:YVTN family beta-propeller protein